MGRFFSFFLALAIFTCSFPFSAADINLGISDFQCPTGHSIYPHPERCELYYTCYNTQPTFLWQCRSNLLFDLVYNGCNWPEQTYCGNRTRPDSLDLTTSVHPLTTKSTPGQSLSTHKPITCPDDGFYPAYADVCSSFFYTCLDGYPFPTDCPSYGVFEPVSRRCISPNAPTCKNALSPTSPQPSPTSIVTSPLESTSRTDSTEASATTAAPTIAVQTTTAPTTMAVVKTTAVGSFVCPGNGTYPDPSQCSHYYTCDNGNAYLFACPSGLVFNPAVGICDWPSSVPSCSGK